MKTFDYHGTICERKIPARVNGLIMVRGNMTTEGKGVIYFTRGSNMPWLYNSRALYGFRIKTIKTTQNGDTTQRTDG